MIRKWSPVSEKQILVTLTQQHDYRFDIRFHKNMPVLTSDEPAPLGTGLGPSPVQLLCAAVGNCLSDSLLFALRKFKQDLPMAFVSGLMGPYMSPIPITSPRASTTCPSCRSPCMGKMRM